MKKLTRAMIVGCALIGATVAASAQAIDMIPCTLALQGRVAWNDQGNTVWAQQNVERLCRGGRAAEPARCFDRVMHGGVDWGGGTRWRWENAITLCQASLSAEGTVACFEAGRAQGLDWQVASARCSGAAALRYAGGARPAAPSVGVGNAIAVPVRPPPVAAPPANGTVSSDEFRQLQQSLDEVALDDDKVARVRDFLVGGRRFTCAQVAALMRNVALDDAKVEIGALLWPRVVDRENVYQVTRAFLMPSAAAQFRERVGL